MTPVRGTRKRGKRGKPSVTRKQTRKQVKREESPDHRAETEAARLTAAARARNAELDAEREKRAKAWRTVEPAPNAERERLLLVLEEARAEYVAMRDLLRREGYLAATAEVPVEADPSLHGFGRWCLALERSVGACRAFALLLPRIALLPPRPPKEPGEPPPRVSAFEAWRERLPDKMRKALGLRDLLILYRHVGEWRVETREGTLPPTPRDRLVLEAAAAGLGAALWQIELGDEDQLGMARTVAALDALNACCERLRVPDRKPGRQPSRSSLALASIAEELSKHWGCSQAEAALRVTDAAAALAGARVTLDFDSVAKRISKSRKARTQRR